MTGRQRCGAVVALLVAGTAACAVPAPTANPAGSATPAASSPVATVPPSVWAARPSPSPKPRRGLAAEIEVHSLGVAVSATILEYASTGSAIIFSSGMAEDAGTDAAPDLWRYELGPSAEPELVWRNSERDHSLVNVGGDLDTMAFVDIPLTGERAWDLWLVPEDEEPFILDTHPGDEEVSSLVPSFSIQEPTIAWTAFDRGPAGPVSQLLAASAPDWEPRVLVERHAAEAELWLPSLYGSTVVYTEVRYASDRLSDERGVYMLDIGDPTAKPIRLDTSGRATMPLITDNVVVWKEADPGFNMFNWGKMFRYDRDSGEVSSVDTWPQEYVNYPSVGSRFIAWWGANSLKFGVYDLVTDRARLLESYTVESHGSVLRPHVSGDLLVWLYVDRSDPDAPNEVRFAFLPNPKEIDR